MLDLTEGHRMYYEEHGSPSGKPVVVLHGGPGGGIQRSQLKSFDLKKWRVIMFDQRGCGRSTPRNSLEANTTWHLVEDIERLRAHLGIEKWTVFGGSWGSTLALAYAETHPKSVTGLIVRGIYLAEKWENDWLYEGGVAAVWPDEVSKFRRTSKRSMMVTYKGLLRSRKTRRAAAVSWWGLESALSFLKPKVDKTPIKVVEELAVIENHYFSHNCWLKPGQLLRNAYRLRKIPTIIIQGRYDMVCPFRGAWELKQRMPHASLVVTNAGHAGSEPETAKALRAATNRLL